MKQLMVFMIILALLAACEFGGGFQTAPLPLKPFADARLMNDDVRTLTPDDYTADDIITYTFNKNVVFEGNELLTERIMEDGKNPGLGVRSLHAEGVTGRGVNVAIIDQNLLLDHPEFVGKIKAYYDTGCNQPEDSGSMHAPAVASLLVGDSNGVAPEANVYFAAAPSWTADSKYYADALDWIVGQNALLPEGEKIRVVSISAAPSLESGPFKKNHKLYQEAVERAQDDGILVLDCANINDAGLSFMPGYYDPDDRESVEKCVVGWPSQSSASSSKPSEDIVVPCSYRTVAEEYTINKPSYQYTGQGGFSWGMPYAAGVLALGWQINPDLDYRQIADLLNETCVKNAQGWKIIAPRAFVEAVKKTV